MEPVFVGLDIHKRTIQVSVMDRKGEELLNRSIPNTPEDIRCQLEYMPEGTRLVMESSSVWKVPFHQMRDELGLDVSLSNPYTTRLIAESRKKTDRVDARVLADMLRGGYIATCHVPGRENMEFYNERRTHFSLDIDNGQTPLMAFGDKRATDAIRNNNPKWMEEDTDG